MTAREAAGMAAWALLAGAVVALLGGRQQAVSLRVWLAGFAIWFAIRVARRMFEQVTPLETRLRLLFGPGQIEPVRIDGRPHELRAIESLLLRALENERTHARQLRPRLTAMADHFLLVNHGVDRAADPAAAAEVLGDVSWLIDDVTETVPSLDQIERFVDVLTVSEVT